MARVVHAAEAAGRYVRLASGTTPRVVPRRSLRTITSPASTCPTRSPSWRTLPAGMGPRAAGPREELEKKTGCFLRRPERGARGDRPRPAEGMRATRASPPRSARVFAIISAPGSLTRSASLKGPGIQLVDYRVIARANNVGWRIDYCMASAALKPRLKHAWIEARPWQRPLPGRAGAEISPVGATFPCVVFPRLVLLCGGGTAASAAERFVFRRAGLPALYSFAEQRGELRAAHRGDQPGESGSPCTGDFKGGDEPTDELSAPARRVQLLHRP